MTDYIKVKRSTDSEVFLIRFQDENLGAVHFPGNKEHVVYCPKEEIDLWQMKQIVNFMEIGPCPDCGGYVHPEEILIHCTACDYILWSG